MEIWSPERTRFLLHIHKIVCFSVGVWRGKVRSPHKKVIHISCGFLSFSLGRVKNSFPVCHHFFHSCAVFVGFAVPVKSTSYPHLLPRPFRRLLLSQGAAPPFCCLCSRFPQNRPRLSSLNQ